MDWPFSFNVLISVWSEINLLNTCTVSLGIKVHLCTWPKSSIFISCNVFELYIINEFEKIYKKMFLFMNYIYLFRAKSCKDCNECSSNNGNGPCQHKCINKRGTFQCVCNVGFKLDVDGISCIDVDECKLSGKNLCHHTCVNNYGRYVIAKYYII